MSHHHHANDTAAQTADHLAEAINSKDHNGSLANVMSSIEEHKKSLTPAQYREYITDLNEEIKDVLPGLTIGGVLRQNGEPTLAVNDKAGGTQYFSANEANRLNEVQKHAPRVFDRPDGTHVVQEGPYTSEFKQIGPQEWTSRKTGPHASDNSFAHQYPTGRQVIQYGDGRRTDNQKNPDGSWVEHGTGPRPHDNYESRRTRDGHFVVQFRDGSKVESYKGQVKRTP